MAAQREDFTIEQGTTWSRQLICKDADGQVVNISGYTARMQVRATIKSTTVLLNLTTENGGITIDGANGAVNLLVTPAMTTGITEPRGDYDIELVDTDSHVTRILKGVITFDPEVTR